MPRAVTHKCARGAVEVRGPSQGGGHALGLGSWQCLTKAFASCAQGRLTLRPQSKQPRDGFFILLFFID